MNELYLKDTRNRFKKSISNECISIIFKKSLYSLEESKEEFAKNKANFERIFKAKYKVIPKVEKINLRIVKLTITHCYKFYQSHPMEYLNLVKKSENFVEEIRKIVLRKIA